MNREKFVFSKILEGVDCSWSAKEKARYIYYQLAKRISYDRRFMFGTSEAEMHAIYNRVVDVDMEESPEMVCNSANKVYLELLTRAGVKSEIIYSPSKIKRNIPAPNAALKFYDENGDEYYTNIIGDIENCRFDCMTHYFGIVQNNFEDAQNVKAISSSELNEMDKKVRNIREDYVGELFFYFLKKEVKNSNTFRKFLQSIGVDTSKMDRLDIMREKMKYINMYIRFDDVSTGPDERNKFYLRLFRGSVFDQMEAERLSGFEFVKRNSNGTIESTSVLELNLPDCPVYYVFDENERRYIQVSVDEIQSRLIGYEEKKGRKMLIDRTAGNDKIINEW